MEKTRKTNREFAEQDVKFKDACERVETKPTSRQASKYRNKKGLAYKGGV